MSSKIEKDNALTAANISPSKFTGQKGLSPKEAAMNHFIIADSREVKNLFQQEVQDILKDLDVSLSENLSELDEHLLSDEGRSQRRDLAMAKQELSELDLFDEEAYEEVKIQKEIEQAEKRAILVC